MINPYESLCSYDPRHPNHAWLKDCYEKGEVPTKGPDCACDNCFYGRTSLAEEIIRLREGPPRDLAQIADQALSHLASAAASSMDTTEAKSIIRRALSVVACAEACKPGDNPPAATPASSVANTQSP